MKKIVILAILICGLSIVADGFTQRAEAGDGYTAQVLADSLVVRSDADGKSTVVGNLAKGAKVEVSDEAFGWAKIKAGKLAGWVAGYYLKKTGSGDAASSGSATSGSASSGSTSSAPPKRESSHGAVTADSLRVRSGSGLNYDVIGGLFKGDIVTIEDSSNGWLHISASGGLDGWVSSDYIGKTSAVETASAGDSGSANSSSPPSSKGLKGKVIVVDAGHGGDDPGMIGTTYKTLEKDVNLSTAQHLADELRSRGAKVVMTRTKDDQKPALQERVDISESAHADAFVSIHYNSAQNQASGTLTFYYSESKDKPLAQAVENRLNGENTGLRSNGVAFGDYHVVRENDDPAVLVELGFLSNGKDEGLARKSSYQQKAAVAIADGLADYFK